MSVNLNFIKDERYQRYIFVHVINVTKFDMRREGLVLQYLTQDTQITFRTLNGSARATTTTAAARERNCIQLGETPQDKWH